MLKYIYNINNCYKHLYNNYLFLEIQCGDFCDLCENNSKCVQCISDEYYIHKTEDQWFCKKCNFPFQRCSSENDPIQCLPS